MLGDEGLVAFLGVGESEADFDGFLVEHPVFFEVLDMIPFEVFGVLEESPVGGMVDCEDDGWLESLESEVGGFSFEECSDRTWK